MLLLFLSLFFNCYLLHCDEIETANLHGFLRTGHGLKARHDDYINYSITEVSLTPENHQTDRITPEYSGPRNSTPVGNETNTHENSTSNHTQDPGLSTPSKYPELFIYPTYTPSPTGPKLEGTSSSSTDVVSFYITVYPPGFGPDSVNTEATVDPSVAEYAKKWLEEVASTTATSKLLIPKLGQIFGYDYSADGFPLLNRRNQKTSQRKISNRQLKNNDFRHQTRPIVRREVTVPQISKRRHPQSEARTFWHDPPTKSEEGSSVVKTGALNRTRRTETTVTKQRLEPGLLLGRATIGDDSNTDDDNDKADEDEFKKITSKSDESKMIIRMATIGDDSYTDDDVKADEDEFKKITSGTDESKMIMRMRKVTATTKKQWYSDRTEVQKDVMGTAPPTTRIIEYVRHSMFPPPETTSTTQKYSKMKEIRRETYMIVFLTELSRLVATKEKKAVHDVLKHADQIIHGYFKSGKLQWFPQTLIHATKKIAKLLKESEIGVIQKQAADLHHILKHRSQMVSEEVNKIIEFADRLYDDDEGKHLLGALNEFKEYPNTTLSSYWLCNSLINNFLRPYRRLTDTRQRQQLMDSVNKALKKRFTLSGANDTTDETLTQKKPSCETTKAPKKIKRKRHHRSHKRNRQRKRNRTHKHLPDKENLMLRSMAPRTSVQPSVVVTT